MGVGGGRGWSHRRYGFQYKLYCYCPVLYIVARKFFALPYNGPSISTIILFFTCPTSLNHPLYFKMFNYDLLPFSLYLISSFIPLRNDKTLKTTNTSLFWVQRPNSWMPWDFYFFKLTQPLTVSTVQLLYTMKEKKGKPDRKSYPRPYGLRNLYRNLKSENSQDYAQKPQRNWTFMNSASVDILSGMLSIFLPVIG